MNIEKRIERLEKKAGIHNVKIPFMIVQFWSANENKNPECEAFMGDAYKLCIRFNEFRKTKRNSNKTEIFLMNCKECEGVPVEDAKAEAGRVKDGDN